MQVLYQARPGPASLPELYAVDALPVLRLGMVAGVDGAVTVEGRSRGLSSRADKAVYHLLRSLCDVVLVGAGTARTEGYRPAVVPVEGQEQRLARGQRATPLIAVVTRSGTLPPTLAADPEGTVVVTTDRLRREGGFPAGMCVVGAGDVDVDLARGLAALHELGLGHVLCEGGPQLNGALLAAGLVDEICLTTAPVVTGGTGPHLVAGVEAARSVVLQHLLLDDDVLLARWRFAPAD